MSVTGRMAKRMEKVFSNMQMGRFNVGNGLMTKQKVLVFIFKTMAIYTKVIGQRTNSMVMEKRLGLMVPSTKANMNRATSTGRVTSSGVMDPLTKAFFTVITLMVKAAINGQTGENTQVAG